VKPLPEKFKEYISRMLGQESDAFLASLQEPAPVSVRVNPLKGKIRLPIERPVPWSEYGSYLSTRPVFTLDPWFHAGAYYVQEASSMFLEQALRQSVDLTKSLNVLDLCAAPGGKSTHLLTLLNAGSLLVSNEAIRSRAMVLSENVQKWGYPNTIVSNNDPADFQRLSGFFDVMVVDAPCSGEGLFRKDARAMDEWSPEAVQLCCSRQKRIVADAWSALRQDGILIYCTCTYNEAENEENLEWMNKNYGVEFLRLALDPSWGVQEVTRNGIVGYRLFPHRTGGEGFFLSVMKKTDPTKALVARVRKNLTAPPASVTARLKEWIIQRPAVMFQFQDLVFYAHADKAAEIDFALQHLRVLYAGTNLARVKHDKLIPEHALALSVELAQNFFPRFELSTDEALQYLRRESPQLTGGRPGFALVAFEGIPLGWVNVLSNRINSLYPSEWRIRMR
jgi:16S rRNA C967 or C1407 C5-methylase (RsmB/RsmF family)/NOL1/NOP2/fmu family ribosome biogenesis protein